MGVDARKPPLPAETDTSTTTDLATDVSRRTDKTSYSIPDDGSPITISTKRRKPAAGASGTSERVEGAAGLSRGGHQSQTSLLIEYFEGGKPGDAKVQSRPSVRVKVTPSTARKLKETNDHIEISETGRARQPSYTKRISLGPHHKADKGVVGDEADEQRSMSSYASATEESNLTGRHPPVEIEVMRKDASPLLPPSSPRDSRYIQPNPSDISSMPPESLLEQRPVPGRARSRSISKEDVVGASETLKTPSRRRSRSLSKERLTQKVIEKLGSTPGESGSKHKHHSSSRRSSRDHTDDVKSSRRRSSKSHREEDFASGQESSLLTTSQLSGSKRSGDVSSSAQSGTSRASINNPRFLQTVEETIRRLVLPEIEALRHEQQSHWQRSRSSKDPRDSFVSGSSGSRDEGTRRVSKISSAPDVIEKPKVVLRRGGDEKDLVLSGDSVKGRSQRKSSREFTDSPSRRKAHRKVSDEMMVEETTPKKRSKDHGLRNAAAAGMAGVLTAAALRHHDSGSSLDLKEAERRERRRRRSKSRSRSASITESFESPLHRDVPPMPLSSDIQSSDLTRQSILTERTERPPSAASQGHGTPSRELASPSRTPTRTPVALKRGLRTHHSNTSRGDLSLNSPQSDQDAHERTHEDEHVPEKLAAAGVAGAALGAAAAGGLKHHDRPGQYDSFADRSYNARRVGGLSPIQSVASYQEDAAVEPSYRHSKSAGSLTADDTQRQSGVTAESESWTPTKGSPHTRGIQEVAQTPRVSSYNQDLPNDDGQYWYEQHRENDRNRSFNERLQRDHKDPLVELKHLTNYTDDSVEDDGYYDKVAAGQHVMGVGANPEYRHTPVAVESAVASLHDPSVVDVRSTRSGHSRVDDQQYADSLADYRQDRDLDSARSERDLSRSQRSSPLKPGSPNAYHDGSARDAPRSQQDSYTGSPHRMGRRSEHDEPVQMTASGLPDLNDPMPAIGHVPDDESDMTTNPSIIQGPIGGIHHGDRDHWPYEPTPPQSNGNLLGAQGARDDHTGLKAAEAGVLGAMTGAGLGAAMADRGQDHEEYDYDEEPKRDLDYQTKSQADEYDREMGEDLGGQVKEPYGARSSPLLKDEGYISAANPRSPGAITPEPRQKGLDMVEDAELGDGDDVFTTKKHARHVSGMSQGMSSPLYDSALGRGLDRIASKDVVALMDLLTVRDAQRNARDTEILVTLVRSAAEMRNSFEDMKKLLAEQEKFIVNTTDKNMERNVQKAMHGPRPQPFGGPRGTRRSSTDEEANEDIPAKRRNVFRRALKGLSMRSSNDLANIETMLNQLLGDVEGLKVAQELQPARTQAPSLDSYDNLRTVPEGYEPEGQAGTGSTNPSGSGFFSNTSSRQTSAMRGFEGRRASEHRISTVEEGDEDLAEDENMQYSEPAATMLSPPPQQVRGSSVPLDTPPHVPVPTGAQSSENTPKTEKARKHKSTSSFFFPKISRWSETTASSVAKNFRSSGRKERDSYLDAPSRSGSEGDFWNEPQHDPQGADRLPSGYSAEALPADQSPESATAAAPATLSPVAQEDPKYQAHRNSLNLQHPQPRAGHRYQYQLESSAQDFAPTSPTSEQWGSNSNLNRYSGGSGHRYSGGNLSPISDGRYAQETPASAEQAPPPRPPKIPEGTLTPKRPPKIRAVDGKPQYASSPLGSGHLSAYCENQSNATPRSTSGQYPQRKPTGPRPLSSAGANANSQSQQQPAVESPGSAARRNRNRDTFGLGGNGQGDDGDEDVTF